MFIGYHAHNGGKWSGYYLVVDAEVLASCPSSQTVHVHRIKEIVPDEKLNFPIRDGSLKNPDLSEQARREVEASRILGKDRDDLAPTAEDLPPETLGDQGKSLGDQGRLDGRVELIAGDDEWVVQGDYLIRVHKFPRMCLFTPLEAEDPPPVPMTKSM